MAGKTLIRRLWDNMHNRVRGKVHDGCWQYRWHGREVGWPDFKSFRDWAYSNGWFPGAVLDRKDSVLGYTPNNCHFMSRRAHYQKTMNQHKPQCKCIFCTNKRLHDELSHDINSTGRGADAAEHSESTVSTECQEV